MWNKAGYALLYAWVTVHAVLPMRVLYVLSDLLYVIVYKIAGYRLKVVRRNMKASFPDKTAAELRRMERDFYRHFSDYIVETIKLAHISLEEVQRRAHLRNPEVVNRLFDEGHTCVILLMVHYGNWEWFSASNDRFHANTYQIYRPLSNPAFDRLFIRLRTRFGSYGMKKNDTFRDIVRLHQSKSRSAIIFLADQTPSKANLHYQTTFLNQDTYLLTGPERIARKLNLPVVFLDTKKVKRGHYTIDFELLTASPKDTPENWITEQYARKAEQRILRNPACWLWTHKRWKYSNT
ncbi:lipid A biosynthesis lauroyl acyltransferase [Bacteroidales bacterium Barb6]|nr:lipid A biosynthesis lauroyl acyltransferase [Bacteroidales bacterium Barb6]